MNDDAEPIEGPQEDFEIALTRQLEQLAEKSQQRHKILIVDDEPDIVEEISGDLRIEGYDCVTASDGNTGLQRAIDDKDISIVVSDIRMPGMDGLEMIRQIRKAEGNRELAFIVLTGHGGFDDAVEALRLEAFEFLSKPVSLAHLLHVVNLARDMCDMRVYERNLKDFLIGEGRRRSRQVQALEVELAEMKERVGRANESQRRSLFVKNLMRENEDLKEQIRHMGGQI